MVSCAKLGNTEIQKKYALIAATNLQKTLAILWEMCCARERAVVANKTCISGTSLNA